MTVIKSTVLWFKWNLEEFSSCEVKDTLSTVCVLLLLLCITSAGPNIVDNCGVGLHTLRRDRGTIAAFHRPLLIQSFGKIMWKMVQEAEAY